MLRVKSSKLGLICCLFWTIYSEGVAQSSFLESTSQWITSVRELGIADGFKREGIHVCYQDSIGFYWLFSESGLYRFDGQRVDFHPFQSLVDFNQHSTRMELCQDADGHFWLLRLDKNIETSEYVLSRDSSNAIYSFNTSNLIAQVHTDTLLDNTNANWRLIETQSGLFLSRDGFSLFELRNGGLHHLLDLRGDQAIEKVYRSEDQSTYYVLDSNGQLFQYAYPAQKLLTLQLDEYEPITDIVGNKYHLLLNAAKSKLLSYNLITEKRSEVLSSDDHDIVSLSANAASELIYKVGDDLVVFQDSPVAINLISRLPLRDILPAEQHLESIWMLNDQWWFLLHRGLAIATSKPNFFTSPQIGNYFQISVRDLCPFGRDSIIINTYSGTFICQSQPFSCRRMPGNGIGGGTGYGLWPHNEYIYSGLHWQILVEYHRTTGVTTSFQLEKSLTGKAPSVLVPFVSATGKIWGGMRRGVSFVNEEGELEEVTPQQIGSLYKETVNLAVPLADSLHFWLASTKGLFLFDAVEGKVIDSVAIVQNREVVHVLLQDKGEMWVSCATGPIYRLNKDYAPIDSFRIYQKNIDNTVHACLADSYGAFWIPTDDGLYRYDTLSRSTTRFDKKNGDLPFDEFNKLAWMQAVDGTIWLGGTQGLVKFDPGYIAQTVAAQPNRSIAVTELAILKNDNWLNILADPTYFNEKTQHYVIPTEISTIRLSFSDFDPDRNDKTYYYRFSDQQKWLPLDQSQVLLSNPAKKKYQIEVAIRDNRHSTSQTTSIQVQFLPPWYLRGLGIPFWMGLFSLLLWILTRIRTWRITTKNQQLQRLVEKRTQTIAQDKAVIEGQNKRLQELLIMRDKLFAALGHELQHPLNKLNKLSEKAAFLLKNQDLKSLDELSQQLNTDAIESRLLLDNLLGWGKSMLSQEAAHQQSIPVYYLVQDTIALLLEMSDRKQLFLHNNIPQDLHLHFDRFALTIILRNLLHNAIKFSAVGGNITITYLQGSQRQALVISDQGIGLPAGFVPGQTIRSQAGTQGEKGTGLGLHLSMTFAQKNQSRLMVVANDPRGVRAYLWWDV